MTVQRPPGSRAVKFSHDEGWFWVMGQFEFEIGTARPLTALIPKASNSA
jgi:hypothetical protein